MTDPAAALPDPPESPPSVFSNERLDVGDIPRLDDEAFDAVDPRYLRGWLTGFGVAAAAVSVGGVVLAISVGAAVFVLAISSAIVALLVVAAVYTVFEVRRLGYQLREHDVSLRDGVVNHRVATVPFSRVQHVTVSRSAFERLLGLATVHVSSAGPDIAIPGLAVDAADRIKHLITDRAGVTDEAVADQATPGQEIAPDPFAAPPVVDSPVTPFGER